MNAAAADRLEDMLRGRNLVTVKTVRVDTCPMVPSLVRQRFQGSRHIEINDHGMGAEQPEGSWLWVDATQPGGTR